MANETANQMGITTIPKIRFRLLPWICFLFLQFSFAGNASETCREDSECLTPDTYCLDGFCDGHCLPCQYFVRETLSSVSCAKREKDCGHCLNGTVSEELVGMRHVFQCRKDDEVSTHPSIISSIISTIHKWIHVIKDVSWFAYVFYKIFIFIQKSDYPKKLLGFCCRRNRFGTSLPTLEKTEEKTTETERKRATETEGSVNYDELTGILEGVTIELSNYRNISTTSQTPDGVPFSSIKIEPDDADNGSGKSSYEHIYLGHLSKVKE